MKKRLMQCMQPMLLIALFAVICPVVVCAASDEITGAESEIQSLTKSSKKYTDDELMDLAVKYYKKKEGKAEDLSSVAFDSDGLQDGKFTISVGEDHGSYWVTLVSYTVNCYGKGTDDSSGEKVDLSSVDSSSTKIPKAVTVKKVSNTKSGLQITWKKVSKASGYILYRKTGSGSYKRVKKLSGGSRTSWTDTSVKAGKTYAYKIRAYNSGGKGKAGKAVSTVRLKAPTLKSAVSKANGKVKLTWSKSKKAVGYQIQVSRSKSFSTVVKTQKTTKTSVTVKSLKAGKTYYFRVRSYVHKNGKTIYSAWSAKKKVKAGKKASSSKTIQFSTGISQYGNDIYFAFESRTCPGANIEKYNLKTKKKTVVAKGKYVEVLTDGKYLYAVENKGSGGEDSSFSIYRMNMDGTKRKLLDHGYSLVKKGNVLFYIKVAKDEYRCYQDEIGIYRMDLSGKNKKRLYKLPNGKYVGSFGIAGNYLYFSVGSTYYRMNLNGNNRKKVNIRKLYSNYKYIDKDSKAESKIICKGWTYKTDQEGKYLYAVKNGTKKRLLSADSETSGGFEVITLNGKILVGTVRLTSNYTLYCYYYLMDPNGSNRQYVGRGVEGD